MSLASHRNSDSGKIILNKSHTASPVPFPRDFCWSIFQNPDWHFLSIFAICAVFLGGSTLSLSMREISKETSNREIIEIQNRYARLVLNVPAKTIKKIKASPPPSKIARKEEELKKTSSPEIEQEEALPLQEKAEKKEVEIIIAMQPPAIEIKPISRYDIKEDAVQIELELEGGPGIVKPSDIPVPKARSIEKYATQAAGQAFIMEVPDVDIKQPKRYYTGERPLERGGPDIAPALPATGKLAKRYALAKKRGTSQVRATGVRELQRPTVLTASNVPDTRGGASKRYVMARRGRSSNIPSQERYASSAKGIASGIPLTERPLSRSRVVDTVKVAPPDLQTRVSRSYSSKRVEGASRATSRSSYPEQALKKESKTPERVKSAYYLPETAAVRHLAACVDPTEETRLKRQILAFIDGDIPFCADSNGKYAFVNTEMLTTLDVRFVSYRGGVHNRCDALRMTVQCLYSKKTKR
ncbi:MAG: hypothetical protein IMF07_00965 [Proteobacteria bacterium]|nr:hypothetical protein [Pseudomonadota bacterium]